MNKTHARGPPCNQVRLLISGWIDDFLCAKNHLDIFIDSGSSRIFLRTTEPEVSMNRFSRGLLR